ncbi:hypothetical protein [Aeromonas sobria]|uniref:hypothetical protein n=1 Tax=Aeromonas sobria TaxID=646 RepID=UPI003B8A61FC
MLIQRPFQPDISPPFRVGNADTLAGFPHHVEPGPFQGRHHRRSIGQLTGHRQRQQPVRDGLRRIFLGKGQITGGHQRPLVQWVIRIMQAQLGVDDGLPGIDPGPVSPVEVRL